MQTMYASAYAMLGAMHVKRTPQNASLLRMYLLAVRLQICMINLTKARPNVGGDKSFGMNVLQETSLIQG
jgi:hypothetical protein